jgi:transposase-like protein
MKTTITLRDFFKHFPDDESCLSHLFNVRFGQGHTCPSCERPSKWHRIKAERAYSCQWCGHHLHPTVGTPFALTRTPLQLWFFAIFLFTTTRNGVAAKELQRQLGVTYKTAWRMAGLIREHMADVDGDARIGGLGKIVEIDETLVGGSKRMGWRHPRAGKTMVMGMLERDGVVLTTVVPDNRKHTLLPEVTKHVEPGSIIHTDELRSYKDLTVLGFEHHTVSHGRGLSRRPDGRPRAGHRELLGSAKAVDQRDLYPRIRQAPVEIREGSGIPLQSSHSSFVDVPRARFDFPAIALSV